jgi:hypothetical protein
MAVVGITWQVAYQGFDLSWDALTLFSFLLFLVFPLARFCFIL